MTPVTLTVTLSGGPFDGCQCDVTDSLRILSMPIPTDPPATLRIYGDDGRFAAQSYRAETYVRSTRTTTIFVWQP